MLENEANSIAAISGRRVEGRCLFVWMREPLMRRVVRWVAWFCVFLIVVSIAGGVVWNKVGPFLPLLAFIALAVAMSWFAFGRRR